MLVSHVVSHWAWSGVWVGLVALSQPVLVAVWFVSTDPLMSVGWDADLLLALLCLLIRQVTSGSHFCGSCPTLSELAHATFPATLQML